MICRGDWVQLEQKTEIFESSFLHVWLDPWIFAEVQTHTFGRYTPILNFLAAGIIEQYDKKDQLSFFAPIIPASTGYNWDDTILFENLTLFGVKYCITCGVTALQLLCKQYKNYAEVYMTREWTKNSMTTAFRFPKTVRMWDSGHRKLYKLINCTISM